MSVGRARLLALRHHLSTFKLQDTAGLTSAVGNRPFFMTTSFANSPLPTPTASSPLIRTAGCLIIGDEILNGKTVDTNSAYFAKYCFELGIDLKRIEVIADDQDEIVEASRRMVKSYDFVISSGGIGPTHDDITYESMAKAFNQELLYHEETKRRMSELSKHRNDISNSTPEQNKARDRMTLFPGQADVLFVDPELWVPIVRMEYKLCILPGVPTLFKRLLEGLKPYLNLPESTDRPVRYMIRTERAEPLIAPFLTEIARRYKADNVKVGSYPSFAKGVTVSLIGSNEQLIKEIAKKVAKELDGNVIAEGTDDSE